MCGWFPSCRFQTETKGVKRSELHRVRAKIRNLRNDPHLPFFLVFVTTADGLNTLQRLGKTKEAGDDEFVQYVIRGINFETMTPPDVPDVEVDEDIEDE